MAKKTVLAIDLGASSGRVVAVHIVGSQLNYDELHRFPNRPVRDQAGTLRWDIVHLWREVQAGIEKGKSLKAASLGVDAWGVDFGLLNQQGTLISPPVHYRDSRTDGMMDAVFARLPRRTVFQTTGIQIMQINTLYQMMSLVESKSSELQQAATFLAIPDLFNFWLTGKKVAEYTNSTTTQMLDAQTGEWAVEMLSELGIPTHILPEVVQPGTRLGEYAGIPVIVPACHDTGSAVVAVPASGENFGYISSGTWSLAGVEIDAPLVNEATHRTNLTNEGGVFGTIRLLKNVMGLWIVQQCRATWQAHGEDYSYAELVELARGAAPLRAIIKPNSESFLPPGDHPKRIQSACKETVQPVPQGPGEVVRAVLESLALAYRDVFDKLEAVSGQQVDAIHIIGGGSQNELLNQMTADATGKPVLAGPVEATVIGNALMQLITLGELRGLAEAREVVANMAGLKRYDPHQTTEWKQAFERYKDL